MKYRIIKRPSNQMYYIQTWDEQAKTPLWRDYNGNLGEPSSDWLDYSYYRLGFFSLRKAKRALRRIRRQAERDSRPDEVVWEEE